MGIERDLGDVEDQTVGDILKLNAQLRPDMPGLVGLDNDGKEIKRYTFKDYYERSMSVAAALIAKKVKPDDRIALVFMPGTVDACIAFFGCVYSGAIPVCVYPPDPRSLSRDVPKLSRVLQDCNATYVITNAEYYRLAFRPFTGVKWPPVPWLKLNDLKKKRFQANFSNNEKEKNKTPVASFAFLQYTSGSTGDPKGVIVGHKECMVNIIATKNHFRDHNPPGFLEHDGTCFLSWLPHFHDMGLIQNILSCAVNCYTLYSMSPLGFLKSPSMWIQLVGKYKPLVVTVPNFALILAMKKTTPREKVGLDLSFTRFVVGAEPVRKSTLDQFVSAFQSCGFKHDQFMPSYGLAEHVLVSTGYYTKPIRIDKFEFVRNNIKLLRDNQNDDRAKWCVGLGPVGAPYELAIVDPDTKVALGELELGEVWLSGPSKARGYWMKEELTHEVFHSALADGGLGKSGDGYLRTGDYGFMYLCGRRKDLVIVGGRNFYPQDIEEVAEGANSNIRPGCVIVFELEVDDQESIVILAEIREPKKIKDSEFERIADDVSSFVPKTTSGKVSRQPAKKNYEKIPIFRRVRWPRYRSSTFAEEANIQKENSAREISKEPSVGAIVSRQPSTRELVHKEPSAKELQRKPSAGAIVSRQISQKEIKRDPSQKELPQREPSNKNIVAEEPPEPEVVEEPKFTQEEWLTLFCEVIGADIKEIKPETELLSLGIASLLAMQLISRFQDELGLEVAFSDLLLKKTIADLDAFIQVQVANPDRKNTRIAPAKRVRPPPAIMRILPEGNSCRMVPASYSQERIWFGDQPNPEYNIWAGLRIRGDFDPVQFRWALSVLVERHESLRTTFHLHKGHLMQVIHKTMPLIFELNDLSVFDDDTSTTIIGFAKKNFARKFDLTKGPLMATLVVALPNNEFLVHMSMHHIIGDAWTCQVIFGELMRIYAGEELPPLKIQYADYAVWQKEQANSEEFESKLDYWVHLLECEWPTIEFPIPHSKPTKSVRTCRFASVPISDDLVSDIDRTCITLNCTRFSFFLAVYQALLHRHSSLSDVIIGTPSSNRTSFQVESMVGVLVNTLPIRSTAGENISLREMIANAQQSASDANDHQQVPLQKIMGSANAFSSKRNGEDAKVFQAFFIHHEVGFFRTRARASVPGLKIKLLTFEKGWEMLQPSAMFDLQLLVQEDGDQISVRIEYNADELEPDAVSRMAEHYLKLLTFATQEEHAEKNMWSLDLLSEQERKKLLVDWNNTHKEIPAIVGKCTHDLINEQVQRTPDAVALVYPAEGGGKIAGELSDAEKLVYRQSAGKMTYAEIDQISNFVAQHLMSLGVGPDDLVGLCVEQSSWVMVVGMLAIWKAGGAYVALNPRFPPDRLKYMVEKVVPPVILTQTHLLPTATAYISSRTRVVDVDGQLKRIQGAHRPVRPRTKVGPHNLAYVLFTSGSTGLPKGVMIGHQAVSYRATQYAQEHFTPADRVAQVSQYSFDGSVVEIAGSLVCGASLYLAPTTAVVGPELAAFYRSNNITNGGVLTTSRLATLKGEKFPSVKRITQAGEQLTSNVANFLLEQARVFNSSGPTEITFTSNEVECLPTNPVITVGKTIPNYLSYILDRHMQPVPIGLPGELYTGGVGLARGYLGDPGQTQSKFIKNPFLPLLNFTDAQLSVYGDRLYKTGDIVRYRPNGEVEYIGRTDSQVKIRGVRIELGEIETVLSLCPGVQQTVVLVADGPRDSKLLVAYIAPEMDETTLRAYVSAKLPATMVPQIFIMLREFPMSTHGKVERKLLPAPHVEGSAKEEPANQNERVLQEVWSKVLNIPADQFGVTDLFFSLGGDSIAAVTLVYHCKQRGIILTTQQVLTYQTIREQAEVCEVVATSAIDKPVPYGTSSLSPMQHWMFAGPLTADGAARSIPSFNQYALLQLQQVVDVALISRTIGHLLVQHPILRASFDRTNAAVNITEPTQDDVDRLTLDGKHSDKSPLCEVHTLYTSEPLEEDFADTWEARLNPIKGVCVRGNLVVSAVAPDSYPKLLLVIHSLCIDKVSWNIILADFQSIYYQLQNNSKVTLQTTSPFRIWADSVNSMAEEDAEWCERQSAYWRRALSLSASPLALLDGTAKESVVPGKVRVRLSAPSTSLLLDEAIHSSYRTTVSDILLTALLLAYTRWTGTPLLRVDLTSDGREKLFDDVDLSHTVGCCASKYPVMLQLTQNAHSSERFVRDALLSVKEAVHSVPNSGIGYGMLRYMSKMTDAILPEETHDSEVSFRYSGKRAAETENALYTVMQGGNGEPQDLAKVLVSLIDVDSRVDENGKLEFSFSYRKSKFKEETIARLSAWYMEELELLINHLTQTRGKRYASPTDYPLARITQAELALIFTPTRPIESVADLYVTSQLQDGMLFSAITDKETGTYTNQHVIDFNGTLVIENMRKAISATVAHFPVLRTEFAWEGLNQSHLIIRASAEPDFEVLDWSNVPKDQVSAKIEELLMKDRARGFDMSKAPLIRTTLVRINENLHHGIFTSHHVIVDGWSHAAILSRMFTMYQLLTSGSPLPHVGVGAHDGFKEFVAWSSTLNPSKAQQYWKKALAGFSATTAIPIISKTKIAGPMLPGRTWIPLTSDLTQKLTTFADKNKFTFGMVLNAIWGVLLRKYSDTTDVVFGTAVSVRPPHIDVNSVGLFMNTVPIRLIIDDEKPAIDVVRALSKQQIERSDYEHLPLPAIQDCTELPRGVSLMDSIFVVQNFPIDESLTSQSDKLKLSFVDLVQRTNFIFVLDVHILGDQVRLELIHDSTCVNPLDASRMLQHYIELLSSFVKNPNQPAKSLSILTEQEKDLILVQFNDSSKTYMGKGECVHEIISEQAKRTPQATALVFPQEHEKYTQAAGELTYQQLDEMSNILANHLVSIGVKVESLVGLCVEQSSWVMIVGMMGIWKAGGAFVALNPNLPPDRRKYMIDKTKSNVVVTLSHLLPFFADEAAAGTVKVVDVDGQWEKLKTAHPSTPPRTAVKPNNLGYILFTSGSTGLPKGVMIEHKVLCLRSKMYASDHYTPEDRVGQVSQYSFDPSAMEIIGALCCGAGLYLIPANALVGPELAAFYRNNNITNGGVLTPSRLATLKGENFPAMKRITSAGEQLTTNLVKMISEQCRIINAAGPTEITFANSEIECFPDDPIVTIGKSLPNYLGYILDRHLQPVPIGVPGELYVGGCLLARGYINDLEKTKERFIPNPFTNFIPKDKRAILTDRMYKTGDVVRWTHNGEMEFIGRYDFQVKLRGVRIELGEIEAVINKAPGVKQVVVMVVDGPNDNKLLVAYVVPEVDEAALKAFMLSKLQVTMIPQVFVMMHEFPTNTSGKVDRKLLPSPQVSTSVKLEPKNAKERILMEVWSKVLNVTEDQIGAEDMFFALGGNSITAVTLVYHAKQQGLIISAQQVLSFHTIIEQAEVAELMDMSTVFDRQVTWGSAPLLPMQQWILEKPLAPIASSSSAPPPSKPLSYNQYALLKLKQVIDVTLVSRALGHLVVHHPALRASYDSSNMTVNFVEPTREEVDKLTQCGLHPDLSPLCETHVLQESDALDEEFVEMWEAQLDPSKGVCVRGVLLSSETGQDANPMLLIVIHHLSVDKASWDILLADFQSAIAQLLEDKKVELTKVTSPFKLWSDNMASINSKNKLWNDKQSSYWASVLSMLPAQLPSQLFNAPPNSPPDISRSVVSLSAAKTTLLFDKSLHAPYKTNVQDVLLTALLLSVTRWTNNEAITVDLIGEGREKLFDGVDTTRTVGCFATKYPVVLQILANADSDTFVRDVLVGVKETLHTVPNQGLGHGQLRYKSKMAEVLPAIAQDSEICFRYSGKPATLPEGSVFSIAQGASGSPQDLGKAVASKLDIDVQFDSTGKMQVVFAFRKSCFQKASITRLGAWYTKELELLVDHLLQNKNVLYPSPSDFSLSHLTQSELTHSLFSQARPVNSVADVYVASQLQQGMLFHTLAERHTGQYTNQLVFDIKGQFVVSSFQRAFAATMQHFPALRTEFAWEGLNEPHVVVRVATEPDFEQHDWRGMLKSVAAVKLKLLLEADRIRGFDLTKAPLIRIIVIRLEDKVYRCIITNHHITIDGWSHATILTKLFTFYQLATTNEVPRISASGTEDGFKEYVHWKLSKDPSPSHAFWRHLLAGVSEPTVIPIINKSKNNNSSIVPGRVETAISVELTQKLKHIAESNSVTVSMVMNATWGMLLQRYSGSNDVVFGSTVSIRPPHIDVNSVGLFMNTVPVRLLIDDSKPALDVVKAYSKQQIARSEHEFVSLAAIHALSDVPKGVSLMDSIMVVENFPVDQSLTTQNGFSIEFVDSIQKTNFMISHYVFFTDNQIKLLVLYDSSFIASIDATRMINHYIQLLTSFAQNPSQATKLLPILTPQEKQTILYDWNQTYKAYPTTEKCMHQLVSEQAQRTPLETALVYPKESVDDYIQHEGEMTYAELDEMSNCLAQHLVGLGIKADDLVGLCVEQSSWVLIVGMLGIWKAGGAYVALNPKLPTERLRYMMDRASAKVVLTMTHLLDVVAAAQSSPGLPRSGSGSSSAFKKVHKEVPVIDVDGQWEKILRNHPPECPKTSVKPQNLAYVLFTSGSTGLPKGVMIEHKALTNVVSAYVEKYLSPNDRVSQACPFTFDPSLTEIFGTLVVGASLYLIPTTVVAGPDLANFWRDNKITNTGSPTPSRLATLKNEELPDVKTILTIGEAVTLNLVKSLTNGKTFINLYGPTEATVACTATECKGGDDVVSIGRPLPNYLAYVLDNNMQPVPCGVAGELYIGGAGLARGYIGDPTQTSSRFVPNPFSSVLRHSPAQKAVFGDKIYKTGDVVRWMHDGNLEYIGRADFQVKLRGLRIELGEIETVIAQCAGVRQSVVTVIDGAADSKILVAYVVPPACDEAEMRSHLASKLPAYMIPQAFIFMDEFPRNPSGKVERNKLPKPNLMDSREIVPPSTNDERTLLAIWSQTMGLDPSTLGVNTNFFEVGGDSLLVIKLISQLRQSYNMSVGVADFLHHPTIADFAQAMPSSSSGPGIDPNLMAAPQVRPQRIASLLPRRKGAKGRSTSVASKGDGSPRPEENFRNRTPSAIDRETRSRAASVAYQDKNSSFIHAPEEYRGRTPSGYEPRARALSVTNSAEAEGYPRARIPSSHDRRAGHEDAPVPTRGRALSTTEAPVSPREPPRSPKLTALEPPKSPRIVPHQPPAHQPVVHQPPPHQVAHQPISIPQLALEDILMTDSMLDLTRRTSPEIPRSDSEISYDSSSASAVGLLRAANSSQTFPAPPSPDHLLRTKQASILAPGVTGSPMKTPGSPSAARLLKRKPSRTISIAQIEDVTTNNQNFSNPLSFLFLRQLIAVIILVIPIVASFVGSYIGMRLLANHFDINQYFLVPLVYPSAGILSTIGFIPYKWIWIGKYKHCAMRLWSWKFMVWWAIDRYRTFISNMFLQYAVGTPFLNWYYILCGMYVGRKVFINTTRISEFDLVILEDETIIDESATLCGHAFDDGVMKLGDVLVRQYSSVGAWSVINPYAEVDEGSEIGPFSLVSFGMYIPAETKWKGSPATQVGTRPFEDYDVGPLYSYASYLWTIPFVMMSWVVVTAIFYGAAFGNIRLLVYIADRYGFLTAGGFLPVGLIGMGTSMVFVGLVLKRFLLGRAFPGTYRVYGSYYLRRWASGQIAHLSMLVTMILSTTSLARWYYSLWGASVGNETEIMMIPPLHDSDLVSIGRSSFLGSETRLLTSQVKDGAMHSEMIHIGSYTFVGNNSCIVGNAFVADDVVVGAMTLLDAEVYPAGSTLVGSPCIALGLRPPPVDAPRVGRFSRILMDWFFILCTCIVISAALAPPIVFLNWLSGRVHNLVLAALFPPIFSWFFLVIFFCAVFFKWVLVGKLDTEPHHAASFKRQCACFAMNLLGIASLVGNLFYGTSVVSFGLRMLGAKVGARASINTLYVDDWDLVSIGNDVYIGENTVIQCHTAEGMVFKCLPVSIGRGCVIGKSTVVLPGAKLKTGTTLGDLSLVMKNEVLENVGGGLAIHKEDMGIVSYKWEGSPAKLQPKNGAPDTAPAESFV